MLGTLLCASSCAGVCAALAQDAVNENAATDLETYLGPVPIRRTAPIYPFELRTYGREGWVALSYIVSPEGKVIEPMIEDSSGIHEFERAAMNAVKDWRYKPATLNGEPVEQSMTRTIIRFQLQDRSNGASPSFITKYKKAQEHLKNHEFDQAKAVLDDLESGGRLNLYEDSWFWWLKYVYMDAVGGASLEQQRDVLIRAIAYEDDYLPRDAFVMAAVRLFALRVRTEEYARALSLRDKLKSQKDARKSPLYDQAVTAMDATAREIQALVDGDKTLKIDATIGGFDYWVHGLLRRSFSITDINGQLDAVEVRCSKRNVRYDSVTGEHTWTIPKSYGDCGAYIKGTPGTTFAFYEYPNEK